MRMPKFVLFFFFFLVLCHALIVKVLHLDHVYSVLGNMPRHSVVYIVCYSSFSFCETKLYQTKTVLGTQPIGKGIVLIPHE